MRYKTIGKESYIVISNEEFEDTDYVEWLEEENDCEVISADGYEYRLAVYKDYFSVANIVFSMRARVRIFDFEKEKDRAILVGQLMFLKSLIDDLYECNDDALEICYKFVDEQLGDCIKSLHYKDFDEVSYRVYP